MSGISTLSEFVREKWMSYFGWSVSRQNAWENCPKAYYYQYIHSWKVGWEEKENFTLLKNLQTLPLIHGTHISTVLRRLLNKELSPDIESLKELFDKEMRETIEKGENRITELYNGIGVSKSYFERHIEDGKKEIENFMLGVYPRIKSMKMMLVDKRDKYTMEGRTFYSAPDFLGIDNKSVWHLMDWKSGTGKGTSESFLDMQLATYAFYAIYFVAKGKMPKRMKLYAVFLQDMSKNIEKYLTREMLKNTKSRIFEMHDNILKRSMSGPFPAFPEEKKCRFCNFATICDEGKYFLDI